MKYKLLIIAVALGVPGPAVGGGLYLAYPVQVSTLAGLTRSYFISWSAPPALAAPKASRSAKLTSTGTPRKRVNSREATDEANWTLQQSCSAPHRYYPTWQAPRRRLQSLRRTPRRKVETRTGTPSGRVVRLRWRYMSRRSPRSPSVFAMSSSARIKQLRGSMPWNHCWDFK